MITLSLEDARTLWDVYVESDDLKGAAPETIQAHDALKAAIAVAKLSEVKPGMVLIADGGFGCIEAGAELVVASREGTLYVPCEHTFHDLEGQVADDGDTLVGFKLKI